MADSAPDSGVNLTAECLCKAFLFTTRVSRTSLPLKATTCHCDSCRYNTGALYSSDTSWPGDAAEIRNSGLSRYVFSENITVMFCSTCGSTMFFEQRHSNTAPDETFYSVFTGVLPNIELPGSGSLVSFEHHMFLEDTKDGGASPWLRNLKYDGERTTYSPSRRWHGRRMESVELLEDGAWTPTLSREGQQSAQEEEDIAVPIRCKCGGVHFEFLASTSRRDFSQEQPEKLPRFIDPVSHKSIADFDVCDSCRLSSGLDIFHWTFFLLKHIGFASHGEVSNAESAAKAFPQSTAELKQAVLVNSTHRDPRLGTLKLYASSPDVQRYFCGRCSAVVFYAVDDRPDQVDVAVGLLRAPGNGESGHDGARAESILSWKLGGKLAWRDDTLGGWRADMVKSVERDVETWRDRRGLPKNWRLVQEEEEAIAKRSST